MSAEIFREAKGLLPRRYTETWIDWVMFDVAGNGLRTNPRLCGETDALEDGQGKAKTTVKFVCHKRVSVWQWRSTQVDYFPEQKITVTSSLTMLGKARSWLEQKLCPNPASRPSA